MTARRREPPWFAQLVDGYLASLRRRGRREATIITYRYALASFAGWLSSRHVSSLAEVGRLDLEAWQDDLMEGLAPSSRQVATVAVKGLLKWCERCEVPMSRPELWRRLETPHVPQNDPRPIDADDLEGILRAFKDPARNSLIQLRDRALFLALLSSGSRIGPVLALDRESIDNHGTAPVVVKGGRRHVLLFSDEAMAAIMDYLSARDDEHPAMFLGHRHVLNGRPRPYRLLPTSARRAWHNLANELGIEPFSSHRIRHTTGTEMLRRKVDSLVIARHLAHRGLGQVMNYARVSLEQRREAVAALSAGA